MIKAIPTFVINLEKRKDRLKHIRCQFENKPEFDVTIVPAFESSNGGQGGLWRTISHIIRDVVNPEQEFFLLIEDDHVFTETYSAEFLFETIQLCTTLKAEILLGGVSWFHTVVPVSRNLFWIDTFNATQFVLVFRRFYKRFIENLATYSDTADINISKIANKKFVIHPYISIQREFGYSDATSFNHTPGYVTQIFKNASGRLSSVNKVLDFYEHNQ